MNTLLAIALTLIVTVILVFFIMSAYDRSKQIQKLSFLRYGFLVLIISILILSTFEIVSLLITKKQDGIIIFAEVVLFIPLIVFAIQTYIHLILINTARGKSIRRIEKGRFIYTSSKEEFELNSNTIEKVQTFRPYSARSAFIEFTKISLKSGEQILFNDYLCASEFLKNELKEIPLENSRYKTNQLRNLMKMFCN